MKNQGTFEVPKNLRKPLTDEEKQERFFQPKMNYVCHHEVSTYIEHHQPSVINHLLKKVLKYLK